MYVDEVFSEVLDDYTSLNEVEGPGKVAFVERKQVDASRMSHFLKGAKNYNRWSNRGPAWYGLSRSYEKFFKKLEGKRVVPCANGGIALQCLAQLIALLRGQPLRWCVSAFGFANSGRGLLTDTIKVDCDARGVLCLDEVEKLPPESFDGLIVTNPFGLLNDFTDFIKWQRLYGKPLLIDNAAGITPEIPNIPYQSFSLHHTKPFGLGEGGMAVVPEDQFETFLKLLEYSPLTEMEAPFWVNNGKLSELSCAAHLCRLEASTSWLPLYDIQAKRIDSIARSLGFKPLLSGTTPSMSLPFLAPQSVPISSLNNEFITLGKYYRPLANRATCKEIFDRIVNIPCHPNVAELSRRDIEQALTKVLET